MALLLPALMGGAGTTHAMVDPSAYTTVEAPVDTGGGVKPFYDVADPRRWTVFDLRPIRARIPRLGAPSRRASEGAVRLRRRRHPLRQRPTARFSGAAIGS
jgi:hypothetical protein